MSGTDSANGHTLGNIVQCDGRGHNDTGHKQSQLAVLAGIVLFQMVAVDQLVQIVGGFGMVGINMGNLRIGLLVDEIVQEKGSGNTESYGAYNEPQTGTGFDGFRHQVEADYAQHNAAGKTQQQTDGTVGVLLQHGTDETAQAGTDHTCQRGGNDQSCDNTHFSSLLW